MGRVRNATTHKELRQRVAWDGSLSVSLRQNSGGYLSSCVGKLVATAFLLQKAAN